MASATNVPAPFNPSPVRPFRRAVLRGLAIAMPPLLTIVIFAWVFATVRTYVLMPVEAATRWSIVQVILDVEEFPDTTEEFTRRDDMVYARLKSGQYIPKHVYETVRTQLEGREIPVSGKEVYKLYVEARYLKAYVVIPVFVLAFILLMYLLGKFMAAGVGRFFFGIFEGVIRQLPLVRNVYSSVKQVTDFVFTESEIEYTRVVAVEYPRRGIWSFGLVTGESMLDIRGAANEPVLSVLMPTSPMPVTGFTVTIKKSEAVDLDLTIDQAFQFIISCGVVVPPHQMQNAMNLRRLEGTPGGSDGNGNDPENAEPEAVSAPGGKP